MFNECALIYKNLSSVNASHSLSDTTRLHAPNKTIIMKDLYIDFTMHPCRVQPTYHLSTYYGRIGYDENEPRNIQKLLNHFMRFKIFVRLYFISFAQNI